MKTFDLNVPLNAGYNLVPLVSDDRHFSFLRSSQSVLELIIHGADCLVRGLDGEATFLATSDVNFIAKEWNRRDRQFAVGGKRVKECDTIRMDTGERQRHFVVGRRRVTL